MNSIFQKMNIDALSFGMSTTQQKHTVIAENIANIDTPNYKASDLKFEKVMGEYMNTGKKLPLAVTDGKHLTSPQRPLMAENFVYKQNNPSVRQDGNDVNLDYEMSNLSANGVMFQTLSTITSHEFTKLKTAIAGR